MSIRAIIRGLRIFALTCYLLMCARRTARLERIIQSGRSDKQAALDLLYSQMGTRVRVTALKLQGLMVKVGQFLSARTDILPTSFTSELRSLQDAVPGVSFEQIRNVIESELGSNLASNFSYFEENPLAAASLGQVHLASLTQGGRVAVKVLRPGIEGLASIDLGALNIITRILQRYTRIGRRLQVTSLYKEFAATVREELDYRREAEHLLRFARQFSNRKDVAVPRCFSAYSTRRILVMEFMDGVKVTDLAKLESSDIDAQRIVDIIVDSYLEQVLEYGFIHVDPHPGNLLVLPDGRLCYLDFGMMSDIPRNESVRFARMLLAAMVRDLDTMITCIEDLGFLQAYADKSVLKKALGYMIDRINGIEIERGPEFDSFKEEFQSFLHDEPLILQAKYMFLGRALGMVLGLVNTLNPNIKWAPLLREKALPKLRRIVQEATQSGDNSSAFGLFKGLNDAIEALFGESAGIASRVAVKELQSTAMASLQLPQKMDKLVEKIDREGLEIHLELNELVEHLARQQRSITRLTSFGLTAVLLPISLYLRSYGHIDLMWEAFVLALLAFLRWIWSFKPLRRSGIRGRTTRTSRKRRN